MIRPYKRRKQPGIQRLEVPQSSELQRPPDTLTLTRVFSLARGLEFRGVMVEDGGNIVFRTNDHRDPIKVYDRMGNLLQEMGGDVHGLSNWKCIAKDTKRDLYLLPGFGQLTLMAKDGHIAGHVLTKGAMLRGVAYLHQLDLYAVSEYDHNVNILDPRTKKIVRTFGSKGEGEGHFMYPSSMTSYTTTKGHTVIALTDIGNRRVVTFDPEGTPIQCYGPQSMGDGAVSPPQEVTLDDSSGDVFDSDPQRISADAWGRILVCDRWRGRVLMYRTAGVEEEAAWTCLLNKPDPLCVAEDAASNSVIVGYKPNRIHVYSYSNGKGNAQILPLTVTV